MKKMNSNQRARTARNLLFMIYPGIVSMMGFGAFLFHLSSADAIYASSLERAPEPKPRFSIEIKPDSTTPRIAHRPMQNHPPPSNLFSKNEANAYLHG